MVLQPQQNKAKTSWARRFAAQLPMLDERDLRCLLISAVCHGALLLVLAMLLLPPSGRPDAELMQVSFDAQSTQDTGPKEKNPLREIDPYNEEVSEKELQELQEKMDMQDADEVREYLEVRKQRIQKKKQQMARFSQQAHKIDSSVTRRSRYGTLKPRTFYGVNLFARSMVFVLDTSGSMNIHEARLQIKNAYSALKSTEYFNIIIYSDYVKAWQSHLVPASAANKKLADSWVDEIRPGGSTNIYSALQKAFEVAWETNKAENIYFLSDGLPTAGPERSAGGILNAVRQWNLEKGIVIHCIGIGPHQDRRFLSALAEQNNGRYYVR